jgi:hypothetical protein
MLLQIVFVFFTILYQLETPPSLMEWRIGCEGIGSSIRFSPNSGSNGQNAAKHIRFGSAAIFSLT